MNLRSSNKLPTLQVFVLDNSSTKMKQITGRLVKKCYQLIKKKVLLGIEFSCM